MPIAKLILTALTDAVIESKIAVADVNTTALALVNAYLNMQSQLNPTPAISVAQTTVLPTQADAAPQVPVVAPASTVAIAEVVPVANEDITAPAVVAPVADPSLVPAVEANTTAAEPAPVLAAPAAQ